jgi:hypothetical protein
LHRKRANGDGSYEKYARHDYAKFSVHAIYKRIPGALLHEIVLFYAAEFGGARRS